MAVKGLKDSQDSVPPQHHTPTPAVNFSICLFFTSTAIPICGPGYSVPNGATVRVRAATSTQGNNIYGCKTAVYREALLANGMTNSYQGDPLSPDTEIIYPVTNLAQIWAVGSPGDGITISVRANPS